MIRLTAEQAQQIEEALHNVGNALMYLTVTRHLHSMYKEMRDEAVEGCNEALATIRAAKAQEQTEQDLDTCPGCGGVADNGHDREFPPNPYYCTKCTEQVEPVAFQFPRDTESWTGGWTIDYKVIRSVDAEIEDNEFKPCLESVEQVLLALEKVYAAPQPMKQEPVAWMHKCGGVCSAYDKEHMFGLDYFNIPLYAAQQPVQDIMEAVDAAMAEMQNINPPLRRSECERLIRAANYAAPVQQVDLTDDEIMKAVISAPKERSIRTNQINEARAVIAADREKNK